MTPAVSCLVPTRGRPEWCCEAVACALAQTVPPLEVRVLDDAMTPEGRPDLSLGARLPVGTRTEVVYEWLPVANLGVKRNILAHQARGDFFAMWDDDDWHHPRRLEVQLEALAAHPEANWCAWAMRLLYDFNGRLWCRESLHPSHYYDGTMLIRRAAWRRLPSLQRGALCVFRDDLNTKRAVSLTGRATLPLYLARVHPGNTTPKEVMPPAYFRIYGASPADVRAMTFDAEMVRSVALEKSEREARRAHANP